MSVKSILTSSGSLTINKVDGSFEVDGVLTANNDLVVKRNIINDLLSSRLSSIEQQLSSISDYHNINTQTDASQTNDIQQLQNSITNLSSTEAVQQLRTDVNNLIIAVSLLWDTVNPQQE